MPYSYPHFKKEVAEHIFQNTFANARILDVGAGSGVYADLLKGKCNHIDAIEIFEPYVEMFDLKNKYRNVQIGNILELSHEILQGYDYFIMGDVIEHMTFIQALNLLQKLHCMDKKMLVAVPYMFPQGAEFNNEHETHLQPDLTPELFLRRYPMMHLLYGDDKYGYYINYVPTNIRNWL